MVLVPSVAGATLSILKRKGDTCKEFSSQISLQGAGAEGKKLPSPQIQGPYCSDPYSTQKYSAFVLCFMRSRTYCFSSSFPPKRPPPRTPNRGEPTEKGLVDAATEATSNRREVNIRFMVD
jgi:hypothetical protein